MGSHQRKEEVLVPDDELDCYCFIEFFCSASLPLACTRWVQSTLSSHCPLSSKQFNLNNIYNFSSEKNSVKLGIEPGAAGSRSKCANHCAKLPSLKENLFGNHQNSLAFYVGPVLMRPIYASKTRKPWQPNLNKPFRSTL